MVSIIWIVVVLGLRIENIETHRIERYAVLRGENARRPLRYFIGRHSVVERWVREVQRIGQVPARTISPSST